MLYDHGTHIQALRKGLGMSQEALGEALGVSRQAISKWESDSAIPEIEKLIALSKLFGVSVGALLGVEAETADVAEATAVEALADRYAAALDAHRPKPRRWVAVATVLALAVVLLGGGHLASRLTRLNCQVSDLGNQVNYLTNNVNNEISGMTARIETILERQNSLIADWSYEILEVQPAAELFSIAVTVTPKRYVEGTSLRFRAERANGDALLQDGVFSLDEALAFGVAEWFLPLEDDIKLSVILDDGTETATQLLALLPAMASDNHLQVSSHLLGGCSITDAESLTIVYDGSIYCHITAAPDALVHPVSLYQRIYVDDVLWEEERKTDLLGMWGQDSAEVSDIPLTIQWPFQKEIPVAPGQVVTLALLVRDQYSRPTEHVLESNRMVKGEHGWETVPAPPLASSATEVSGD